MIRHSRGGGNDEINTGVLHGVFGQHPQVVLEGSRFMQTQKLSTLEKVGFGAGDMALNVVISSMMLIITFFYTDIYGLKTTDLALLFVAVRWWAPSPTWWWGR
jgi:hypothetical protein